MKNTIFAALSALALLSGVAHASIATVGVYDENTINANTVDAVAAGSSLTLADTTVRVANAFANNLGGVWNFDTPVTSASSYDLAYGVSQASTLTLGITSNTLATAVVGVTGGTSIPISGDGIAAQGSTGTRTYSLSKPLSMIAVTSLQRTDKNNPSLSLTATLQDNSEISTTLTTPSASTPQILHVLTATDENPIIAFRTNSSSFARIDDFAFEVAVPGIDETNPVISSLSPANGATSVPINANLVLTFSENIAIGSGDITIKNLDTLSDTVITLPDARVSVTGNTLTINLVDHLAPATNYVVHIAATAIDDLADNSFAGIAADATWAFTTSSDALVAKVFLLGGQSNMVGQAPNSGLPTNPVNLQQPQDDVLFYYPGSALTTVRPGSGGSPPPSGAHFGPEVTFGRAVADASPAVTYAIIKHAENGTALYNDWAPGTGPSYTAFRNTVAAGLAALQAAGYTTEIVGMLWHQGESDAIEGQQANYQTNLTAFITDIRSRYGANLPFLVGEIRRSIGPAYVTVADAQIAVATAVPHTAFVQASDLAFLDTHHFNAPSQITLGQRFAAAFATLETTPPTVTALNPVDDAPSVSPAANLMLTFSENIAIGSGDITIKNLDTLSDTVISLPDARVSVSGAVLTINPSTNLAAATDYAIRIAATAIRDIAGNPFSGISDDTTWNFVTSTVPLRIMCMGDSITAGYTDNPGWLNHPFEFGYRSGLYTLLTNAGYNFLLVGSSTEPWTGISGDPTQGGTYTPPLDLRAFAQDGHHGYGSQSVTHLNNNILAWLASDNPDIILLKIGTNSQNQSGLNTLVNTITTTKPDCHLIIAQIMPKFTYDSAIVDYNTYIRDTLVPNYQALGRKVSMVDQYAPFLTNPADLTTIDQSLFSNGINHPDNDGYDKMAQVWFDGIEALGIGPNIYTNWISDSAFGLAPGQQGLDQDPDGDGVDNGVENFLGTHPGAFSQGISPGAVNATANTFTFTHTLNPTPAPDLAATYRWSKNLTTFTNDGGAFEGTTVTFFQGTPTGGVVTVTASVTGTPLDKLFVDIKVQQN